MARPLTIDRTSLRKRLSANELQAPNFYLSLTAIQHDESIQRGSSRRSLPARSAFSDPLTVERSFGYRPCRADPDCYGVDPVPVFRSSQYFSQSNSDYAGRAARVSGVDQTDAFRELLFPDAPCPKWFVDLNGSSAALLEPELHA